MNNLNTLLESVNNVSIKETTDYLSFSNSMMDMSTSIIKLNEAAVGGSIKNIAKIVKNFFDNAIKFIMSLFNKRHKNDIQTILKNEKKIVEWMSSHGDDNITLVGITNNGKITPDKYSEWIDNFISDISVIQPTEYSPGEVNTPSFNWGESKFETNVKHIDFNITKKLFNADKMIIKELKMLNNDYTKLLKEVENSTSEQSDIYRKNIQVDMQKVTTIINIIQELITSQTEFYMKKTL